MIQTNEITLRPVTAEDDDLLLRLYASTREAELAQVPWTQEQKNAFVKMQFTAQKQHYKATHSNAAHQIICCNAEPVGRLYLSPTDEAFHILDITVLPERRNSGAGSVVLRKVMDEAQAAQKPVTIYVETFNPSQRLFERLGFQVVRTEGLHSLFMFG
ncbi:MAG TPA: GNAT family N-acetyltransferase [Candidatus Angelobacter sp.]|nr:GNAT family N-acetyltransferase [Candidatus Angelobacter sp.]